MTSRSLMVALAVFPIAGVVAPPVSPAQHRAVAVTVPQLLTPADLKVGRLHGVGCSWSLGRDPRPRFVMVDNRALAKIDVVLTIFMPTTGAKDLFPFTFDRWQADNAMIQVKERGPFRRIGSETLVTRTDLVMRQGSTTNALHGIKACGS